MGLLRTLAFIILFYYAFKLIVRFVFPIFAQYLMGKAQQNMQNQYDYMNQQQRKEEGKVTVNTNTSDRSGSHQVDAEDVDFEEIKD